MKHLKLYTPFYKSLNEEMEYINKSQLGEIPTWFKDSFFTGTSTKGKLLKGGKELGMSIKDLNFSWWMVKTLEKNTQESFSSVEELQTYLWSRMGELTCLSKQPGSEPMTLKEYLDNFRSEKGLPPIQKSRFIDGRFGKGTNEILSSVLCLIETDLSNKQLQEIQKVALPVEPVSKTTETIPGKVDMTKVEEEGVTGLTEDELRKKAQTIINTSLIEDESERSDKFKIGSNRMGARIKYKDKGVDKISPEDLAVLDEFFGLDGFVRIKTKQMAFGRGTKYVWKKMLKTKAEESQPTLDVLRTK